MADNGASKEGKHRRGGFGTFMYGYMMRPIRLMVAVLILKIILALAGILLLMFLLSGGINQVKTGQTLVEYALMWGHRIESVMNQSVEGDGPLKINKDGIYFQDADVPSEGALETSGHADDGEFEQWKQQREKNADELEKAGLDAGAEASADGDGNAEAEK